MEIPSVDKFSTSCRDRARAFSERMDRSVIGSFAMDEESFRAVAAREFAEPGSNQSYDENQWSKWELDSDIQKSTGASDYIALLPYRAEVFAWWVSDSGSHDIELGRYLLRKSDPRLRAMVDRLNLVIANPELLRYFEAGFWDIETISEIASSDIDIEIAVETWKPYLSDLTGVSVSW